MVVDSYLPSFSLCRSWRWLTKIPLCFLATSPLPWYDETFATTQRRRLFFSIGYPLLWLRITNRRLRPICETSLTVFSLIITHTSAVPLVPNVDCSTLQYPLFLWAKSTNCPQIISIKECRSFLQPDPKPKGTDDVKSMLLYHPRRDGFCHFLFLNLLLTREHDLFP